MADLQKLEARTVNLVSTMSSGLTKYENLNIRTVGDLKRALGDNVIKGMNIAAMDSNKGKHRFEFDETILPEGDLAVFLSPAKQKGAADIDFSSMGYADLRRYAKENNIVTGLGSNPEKAKLIKVLKDHVKKNTSSLKRPEKKKEVEKINKNLSKIKEDNSKDVKARTKEWESKLEEFITNVRKLKESAEAVLDFTESQEILDYTPSNAVKLEKKTVKKDVFENMTADEIKGMF